MLSVQEVIKLFNLKPLINEGGYYVETYRSAETVPKANLPKQYKDKKSFCTAIYYLLTPDTSSLIHRLPTDEIYHFYLGDPIKQLQLHQKGIAKIIVLGQDIAAGHRPQVIVPKGVWQGSYLIEGGMYALMGTTMAPGFDFSDYESGNREDLIRIYPDHESLIKRLT